MVDPCSECNTDHIADGASCSLADVPDEVPEGVPFAAPDPEDFDLAGTPDEDPIDAVVIES